MSNNLTMEVLAAVEIERIRQNQKWGKQYHHNGAWLAILVEEIGEIAEAMQTDMVSNKDTDASDLEKELTQVAAVAVAWLEQLKEARS